jgi:hypothetical protein
VTSGLDQLLESIDPQRTLDETDAQVDEAINSFPLPCAEVTQWDEFRLYLIGFMRHIEAAVLHVRAMPGTSLDFEWGRCVRFLIQEYGRHGEKAAFEMARTGNEGGLYAVLRKLARRIARQYGESEVAAKVGTWWDRLSADQKLATADEYLRKYGHLLPSELTEGSAARIRANFPKVLEEHPRLLQRMRQLGR